MKYNFSVTACYEGKKWLDGQPNAKTAWKTCPNGAWMWWAMLHDPTNYPSEKLIVEFKAWLIGRLRCYDGHPVANIPLSTNEGKMLFELCNIYAEVVPDKEAAYGDQASWLRKHYTWREADEVPDALS